MQNTGITYFSFGKQGNHNPWLDLLRSFAIFLVLLRHGARIEGQAPPDGFLDNIFLNGWIGVDLFFVLSGYLIANGLIRRFEIRSTLWSTKYFIDRILRIVPAYYAVLLLCLLGFFPGFQIGSDAPEQSFIAHLLFLQDYTGSDINVVFWSLGVEEKFYILAPLLVLLLLKAKSAFHRASLGMLLLLVSPICRSLVFEASDQPISYEQFFSLARSPFHMSLEGFVVGIMVALLLSRDWSISKSTARTGLAISSGILLLLLGSQEFHANITAWDVWLQPTFFALLFGMMLLFAVSLGGEKLKFEPFFRANARLSYALYLVHFPLIPLALNISQNQPAFIFWISYLSLSYAAAIALHFSVEKPFLLLKSRTRRPDQHPAQFDVREAVAP